MWFVSWPVCGMSPGLVVYHLQTLVGSHWLCIVSKLLIISCVLVRKLLAQVSPDLASPLVP